MSFLTSGPQGQRFLVEEKTRIAAHDRGRVDLRVVPAHPAGHVRGDDLRLARPPRVDAWVDHPGHIPSGLRTT